MNAPHRLALGVALATTTVVASARAQSQVPWTPPAIARACDRLANEHESAIRAAAPLARRRTAIDARQLAVCEGTRSAVGGAWISTARDVRLADDQPLRIDAATRALHFIAPDGAVLSASAAVLGSYAQMSATQQQRVADCDNDGRPELLLSSTNPAEPSVLLTVRDNSIVRSSLLSEFEHAVFDDVDSDGRADLVEPIRFTLPAECRTRRPIDLEAPIARLVAFSRDRGFVFGSDAAAFARAQCPERPTVLVPTARASEWMLEEQLRPILRRVLCARVWGASQRAIDEAMPARWPAPLQCVPRQRLLEFASNVPTLLRTSTESIAPLPLVGADHVTGVLDPSQPVLARFSLSTAAPFVRSHCARRAAAVSDFVRSSRRASNDFGWVDSLADLLHEMGACHMAHDGDAWVDDVTLSRARGGVDRLLRGSTRVEFVGRSGSVVVGARTRVASDAARVRWRVVGAHDFDRDGQSEAIVSDVDAYEPGGTIAVLTAGTGTVVLYSPAARVAPASAVADVDDDGRWDLLIAPRRPEADLDAEPPFARSTSVTLVAHALRDGTFSLVDPVARAAMTSQCSRMPSRFLVADLGGNGRIAAAQSVDAVYCARLRGATAEHIVQRIYGEITAAGREVSDNEEALMLAAVWSAPLRL